LANAIDWYYSAEEGLNWLQRGLAQIEGGNPVSDGVRGKALMKAGELIRINLLDSQTGRKLQEESLALYHVSNPTDKRDWTILFAAGLHVYGS
jgi:hypothetical protein